MSSIPQQPDPAGARTQSATASQGMLEVPLWLVRLAGWAWRLLLVGGAAIVFGWICLRLRVVVVPVLAATMIASVLSPLVRQLHARGLPLLAATWVVLTIVGVLIVGVLAGAGWGLTSELTKDSAQWEEAADNVRDWLQTGPLDLSQTTVEDLEENLRQGIIGGVSSLGTSRATLVVELFSGIFLTLALTFFFVKDGPDMWAWLVNRVAPRRRAAVDEAGREAASTLGAYLRAVSLTGVVDAVFIGVGLLIIGVPLVLPLAIITFFAAFLPIVGATAAGALAALIALVANGPVDAILVVLLTLIVQQVEGDVIMPVIMGRQVSLHPAAVLAALTAGGALAGIIGAFVAVPVMAVASTGVGVLRRHRTE